MRVSVSIITSHFRLLRKHAKELWFSDSFTSTKDLKLSLAPTLAGSNSYLHLSTKVFLSKPHISRDDITYKALGKLDKICLIFDFSVVTYLVNKSRISLVFISISESLPLEVPVYKSMESSFLGWGSITVIWDSSFSSYEALCSATTFILNKVLQVLPCTILTLPLSYPTTMRFYCPLTPAIDFIMHTLSLISLLASLIFNGHNSKY